MARSSRSAASRSPFRNISGCSAARLARQLRELEVPSSNLGIPTTFPEKPLRNQWFFYFPPPPQYSSKPSGCPAPPVAPKAAGIFRARYRFHRPNLQQETTGASLSRRLSPAHDDRLIDLRDGTGVLYRIVPYRRDGQIRTPRRRIDVERKRIVVRGEKRR